ncbi:MAG: sensor histidine kinase [Desulfobulbus sp.]|jgi:two-component system nitrogen regulation sensor histidine kinase NtrY
MLTAEQKKKKQRLIRIVIGCCLLLIPALALLQRRLLNGELHILPFSDTLLVFALININGLLLLLMLYLVLRNLVELVFERKQKILGTKLRTRLVISFIALSFIPTAILFFVALRFVSTSMDYWFNARVEESLRKSLKLTQSILHATEDSTRHTSRQLAVMLEHSLPHLHDPAALQQFFTTTFDLEEPGALDALLVLDEQREPLFFIRGPRLASLTLPPMPSEALRLADTSGQTELVTRTTTIGELIQAITPVRAPATLSAPPRTWFLVTSQLIPAGQLDAMQTISDGITGYQQMIILKAPIKVSLLIMLLIITLLILFGAIWFGFYIARSISGPLNQLAGATKRVADGDLDFSVEKATDDEIGTLVDAFNAMTADIRASNQQLEQTHHALQQSTEQSEQQRRYLETILENVAAGVIALDEHNRITTINRFAEQLLEINPDDFLEQDFHTTLSPQHAAIFDNFLRDARTGAHTTISRHLRVTIRPGAVLSLQINVTRMKDERGQPLGFVIVFDNLTNLEKAQRLAAWQEVARRIAHEIKNPLTPIQLSAQRLRKRYLDSITENREIFDQCTATIVNQVEEIKNLVSEFSDFARMPKLRKELGDLGELAGEMALLYQEAHKHLHIECRIDPALPPFPFDAVQIKRVLINLLDNAVSVLEAGGSIRVTAESGKDGMARMRVSDDGPGIDEEIRLRIFEPYYSTRRSGTGLGLAIAHTIVSEHGGRIYVAANQPTGAVFTVELPLET